MLASYEPKCTGSVLTLYFLLFLLSFSLFSFTNNGKLLVTSNGEEERGSRPIIEDHDKVYLIGCFKSK